MAPTNGRMPCVEVPAVTACAQLRISVDANSVVGSKHADRLALTLKCSDSLMSMALAIFGLLALPQIIQLAPVAQVPRPIAAGQVVDGYHFLHIGWTCQTCCCTTCNTASVT